MPQARDHFVDLVAWKLPALARLRALRHLDLQFVRIDQIVRRYSETRRSHLLYRAAPQVAVRIRIEALFIFSALARVRLAANPVHGDRERFMRFFTDGAE